MSFAKGQTLPVRNVNCRHCGAAIQRKSYWRNPSCRECTKKRARASEYRSVKQLRQEARRYRILMALSPYGSWEELLRAVRMRQPRGWAAKFDMTIERRAKVCCPPPEKHGALNP